MRNRGRHKRGSNGVIEPSRELQAVLACARYPMEAGALTLEGLDWARFFQVAQSLGVTALVAGNLLAHCRGQLPQEAEQKLQRLRHAAMGFAARMLARSAEVTGWLQAANMEVLTLKGVPLGALLYGSPLLRHSSDIDLVVRPHDVARAERLLKEKGLIPSVRLDERQMDALIHWGYALDFRSANGKVMVDLHWGFQPCICPLDARKVWERAQTVAAEGVAWRTLSLEDYLLFLCYHPVKHCYQGLRPICDLAALLRHGENLDWDYVWQQAETTGTLRIVGVGLGLAERLLGAKLSQNIKHRIVQSPQVASLIQVAAAAIFHGLSGWRNTQTVWGVRMLDNLWWRTRFLLRKMFVPNEEEVAALSLPARLRFAYYPLRFVRVPWRYGRILCDLKKTSLRLARP